MNHALVRAVMIVVLLATSLGLALAGSNKARLGQWASNERCALRVDAVTTVTSWKGLGKLIRFGRAEAASVVDIQKALDSGAYKFIVVTVQLRNDSTGTAPLGWCLGGDARDFLYLRGEEGSEYKSTAANMSIAQKGAQTWVTRFLADGLPENAAIAPKTVIKGRVAYLVPDWFVPAKLFTRPSGDPFHFGRTDLIVELKK